MGWDVLSVTVTFGVCRYTPGRDFLRGEWGGGGGGGIHREVNQIHKTNMVLALF